MAAPLDFLLLDHHHHHHHHHHHCTSKDIKSSNVAPMTAHVWARTRTWRRPHTQHTLLAPPDDVQRAACRHAITHPSITITQQRPATSQVAAGIVMQVLPTPVVTHRSHPTPSLCPK
jgi:hypothetical protein